MPDSSAGSSSRSSEAVSDEISEDRSGQLAYRPSTSVRMTSLEACRATASGGRGRVRVDVEHLPGGLDRRRPAVVVDFRGHGGDHRDPAGLQDVQDAFRVDADHFADQAQVHLLAVHHGAGADGAEQAAVLSGHSDGVRAVGVDQAHEFPSHLAGEDHPDHVHGLGGGDPSPPLNSDSMPSRLSMALICGPPPCTTTGWMPDVVQEDDVLGEGAAELVVDHGVAAVLDHHGGAGKALDPRQRLDQRAGFVLGVGMEVVSRVWVFMLCSSGLLVDQLE